MNRTGLMPFSLVLVLCLSCATTMKPGGFAYERLMQRAAFDLQCPGGELVVSELGNGIAGVRGCGEQATYVWDPARTRWLMNTASGSPENVVDQGGEATGASK